MTCASSSTIFFYKFSQSFFLSQFNQNKFASYNQLHTQNVHTKNNSISAKKNNSTRII